MSQTTGRISTSQSVLNGCFGRSQKSIQSSSEWLGDWFGGKGGVS